MKSAFDQEFEVKSGRLTVGQRYTFVVVDGTFREKVVSYNNSMDYPKGIVGKEWEKLTEDQQKVVEKAPDPTWPSGDIAPKFRDVLTFSIEQPESEVRMFYGLEFNLPGGRLGKDFYDFYRIMTGKEPEEGTKIRIVDLLPKGSKFTAVVQKDKAGYYAIEKATILPEGATVETAPPTKVELSEVGKVVMESLVAHKETWNGRSGGVILQMLGQQLGGVLTKEQILTGWQEVKGKALDSSGNLKV